MPHLKIRRHNYAIINRCAITEKIKKIGFDPISEPIPNCQCMKYTCQHLGVCGKSRPHLDTIATCSAVIEVYNKTMRIIGCYEVIIGVPKVYAKFLKRFGFWSKN